MTGLCDQIGIIRVDGHVRDDSDAQAQANIGLDHISVARRDGDVGRQTRPGEGFVQRTGPREAECVSDQRIGRERAERQLAPLASG